MDCFVKDEKTYFIVESQNTGLHVTVNLEGKNLLHNQISTEC